MRVIPKYGRQFTKRDIEALRKRVGEKFWEKVEKQDGCWNWKGNTDSKGYGRVYFRRVGKKRLYVLAHRASYLLSCGVLPRRKIIDHLCRNRRCVNFNHFEFVDVGENVLRGQSYQARNARKSHCKRGHALSGNNLCKYSLARGGRHCMECKRMHGRKYNAVRREPVKMVSRVVDVDGRKVEVRVPIMS